MNADQTAVLTRGAGAERLGDAPNQTWLIADADQTGGIMNVVRTTLGPGVDGPPPHFHQESPEMFYLLDGALRILAGDQVLTVRKGDYLLVPPLMHHAWGTPMDTGADVLIVKAPGNNRFEYFRLGDRIRRVRRRRPRCSRPRRLRQPLCRQSGLAAGARRTRR